MNTTDLTADAIKQSHDLLKMTLADFTDADLLTRPCPGANHAAWQLGHLVVSESRMVNSVTPGAMPEPPAGFIEKFSKETAKLDDPAAFPKKEELFAALDHNHAAAVKWVKGLSPSDLEKPTPEPMRNSPRRPGTWR